MYHRHRTTAAAAVVPVHIFRHSAAAAFVVAPTPAVAATGSVSDAVETIEVFVESWIPPLTAVNPAYCMLAEHI